MIKPGHVTALLSEIRFQRGKGEGVAEQRGGGWRPVCSQVRGDRSYLIGMKSGTLIRMVALTNVDFRARPGQSRVGLSSI